MCFAEIDADLTFSFSVCGSFQVLNCSEFNFRLFRQEFPTISPLTGCFHLPSRLLGNHQICLGPVRQRPSHFPLGFRACKKICFQEPNSNHHPCAHGKTPSVLIQTFTPIYTLMCVLSFRIKSALSFCIFVIN